MKIGTAAIAAIALLLGAPAAAGAPGGDFPDKLALVELLRAGKTAELETRLTRMQDRYELGDESKVVFAFSAFANSARDLEARLTRWVEGRPRSFAARAARGTYYTNLGWLARQGRLARHTRQEQFRRMRGYFEKARADFRAALDLRPRLGHAYAALYRMEVASGTKEGRNAILTRGFAADPGSPPLYRAQMWSLQPNWLGSLRAMEDFAARAASRRLTDHRIPRLEGDITLARAKGFMRGRRYRDAVAILSEALALEPTAALLIARGDAYQGLGRQEDAIGDFTRALALLPQNEGALVERARSYRVLGRTGAALADLDLAVLLDPLDPKQLRRRADLNWHLKRPSAALRDLDAAMEFGAWDAWTRDLRGRVHLSHTKNYLQAVEDFRRATLLAPKAPRHWYNLAVAYHRMKDCNTVSATLHYLELCAKDGKCRKKSMRTAERVLAGFVRTHAACRAQLPQPPTGWQRIWARFKSGLVKTIAVLFLKPKTQ